MEDNNGTLEKLKKEMEENDESSNETTNSTRKKDKIKFILSWIAIIAISAILINLYIFTDYSKSDKNSLSDTEIELLFEQIGDKIHLDSIGTNEINVMVEIFEFGDTIREIHAIYKDNTGNLRSKLVCYYPKFNNINISK